MSKVYCEACDRNRDPILSVIRELFSGCRAILEIGSGTGQHAVYFAQHLPHLIWHTSDLLENHESIKLWLNESGLENVRPPLVLDVT
ncbi:MAG: methylase, partial [Gammaproteobacteria bacterium]|nr:methylase [Gammaproteobacteria bacterium]